MDLGLDGKTDNSFKNLLYLECLFPVTSGEIQVIGFRISYAKIAQSVDKVPFLLVEFIRVVDDSPDLEVDDGLAAGKEQRQPEAFREDDRDEL